MEYTSEAKGNVLTVRFTGVSAGWEQWILLSSDRHHDNIHCQRNLEKEHLDQALERGALILDFGDLFCAMQGKYDPRSNMDDIRPEDVGADYLDRIVKHAAEDYGPYAANWLLCGRGNHECVDPETEVLTAEGWKRIAEVTVLDKVGSMHPITKEVVFAHPVRTHRYEYDGEMISIQHTNVDMLVTPNHRIAYLTSRAEELRYRLAEEIEVNGGQVLSVPTCGVIASEGADLSDDEIRLAAWILTDGSVRPLGIYQSKLEMVDRIRSLLDRLDIQYSENVRRSRASKIMGVPLKAKPLDQYFFRILKPSADRVRLLVPEKYKLPSWVFDLSERQFDLFLEELILGDGTRPKSGKTAVSLYGEKVFLEDVQRACVQFGYRASLGSRTRKGEHAYWCLNIVKRAHVAVHSRYFQRVPYSGYVYCLTTPSGNFFARRSGKVYLTGNSSILKRHGVDLTSNLVHRLNTDYGGRVHVGGFGGWVRFLFGDGKRVRAAKNLKYHHGAGGGGPVTRGVIQTNRQAVYLPDADIVVNGHTHDSFWVPIARERLSTRGVVGRDITHYIRTPSYKDEYGDGSGGWHVERWGPPKPIGAIWMVFRASRRRTKSDYLHIDIEFIQAVT